MQTGLQCRSIVAAASIVLTLIAAAVAPLPDSPAQPQQQDPAGPPRPDPAAKKALTIRDALRQLTEEGKAVQSKKRPLPTRPDFASRVEGSPESKDLGHALTRPASPDAFIDAYVRWQLTSFDPTLPAMDDRAFARFMDTAPPMLDNPRAGAKVVSLLQKADGAGPLPADELDYLRAVVGELEEKSRQADAMNTPALEFRSWVAEKLGQTGPRPRQWLLERCAATVRAGWSDNLVKGDISRQFSASVADETFTSQQRQMVADQARRLVGLNRQSFEKVAFMADSSVKSSFSTSSVDEKDVEKWIRRLKGEPVDEPANPRG